MNWFAFFAPLISFLLITLLDDRCQKFGLPAGTLTTIGEAGFSLYIALRLKPRLIGSLKHLLWIPFGFALGDLAYGFNHYFIKKVYGDSIGPTTYALPYILGLSVAIYFLYRLCKQAKESKQILVLGHLVSLAVFFLNIRAIVIPSLFQKTPPLLPAIAIYTVIFSTLESWLVGFSAVLLIVSSSAVVQIILFGLLALTISDIALRYQSVYMNLVGMTIFENGWFFGLALMASGVNMLVKLKHSERREQFSQFMKFYSIRAMTAGYVLLGLCAVWLALSYYFESLHVPSQLSTSLLIALAIFGFAILVANFVDKNLSRITFRLAENRALDRREFPEHLPQEIRTIVEYFQRLNGKISAERDHTLSLSSKMAHNIKSPIAALKVARYSLEQHMSKGCSCCTDLSDQVNLLDISSKTITEIANHLLEEKKRLIGLETVSSSLKKAVTLASASFPRHKISVEASPQADVTPTSGLTEVIMNLIGNAAEASDPDRPILVRTLAQGERVTISVIDRGRGIPESILRQLKSGKALTTKTYGHGIGVASTFDWAKERGYGIDIESSTAAPKSGTSVSIHIPATLWMDEPPTAVSQ